MRVRYSKEIEAEVVSLHAKGLAPSEIDKARGYEPGTAHNVIVERWRSERQKKSESFAGFELLTDDSDNEW